MARSANGAGSVLASAAGMTPEDMADLTNPTVSTVGSPEEKALIAQIVGSVNDEQTATHDMSPDIADLVLGPMLRGTQVTFR